ncbi:hypothetical protein VitviT2T_002792 [Vitis vinifera]|uniref:Uncharacterized protein n=1 Tax=Vitis vinifera TaxID=29760 RepID=A0ABY9BJK2_VITVI|nr:hypothetical protein VitviT2T_002792 [Vitis vinifera]
MLLPGSHEARSALGSESEKLVHNAVEKAMQGRTVLLITHRIRPRSQYITTSRSSTMERSLLRLHLINLWMKNFR